MRMQPLLSLNGSCRIYCKAHYIRGANYTQ